MNNFKKPVQKSGFLAHKNDSLLNNDTFHAIKNLKSHYRSINDYKNNFLHNITSNKEQK